MKSERKVKREEIKKRRGLILLFTFLIFLFSFVISCFNPAGGDGGEENLTEGSTITINLLGGASISGASRAVLPTGLLVDVDIVHRETGETKNFPNNPLSTTSVTARVAHGWWDITVTAHLYGVVYATGTNSKDVQPNQNNTVTVTMGYDTWTIAVSPHNLSVSSSTTTQQFTATVNSTADTGLGFTWAVSGGTLGPTNISSSGLLSLVGEPVGTVMTVTATFTDPNVGGTITASTNITVSANQPLAGGSWVIGGDNWVNGTITATYSGGNASGVPDYSWKLGVNEIETGASHTITAQELNKTITVTVQFSSNTGIESATYNVADLTGIYNQAQLAAINTNATTRAGKYILAVANLSLAGNWTPICQTGRFFGIFDGNGNAISDLVINTTANNQGLFAAIGAGAVVKDLRLLNCDITGGTNIGGVVGYTYAGGQVENCYVTGDVTGGSPVGGVTGWNSGSVIGCSFTGNIVGRTNNAGGMVGNNTGTVDNCNFTGTVVSAQSYVGGVVGNSNGASARVINCSAAGSVSATATTSLGAGGVVGINSSGSTVQSCFATCDVSGNGSVGGVVGENNAIVKYCYATGDVFGSGNRVGGVVGDNNSTSSQMQSCYAIGNVFGTNYYVGGVAGQNIGTIQNCYATGDVNGTRAVGGVLGRNANEYGTRGLIENCYSTSIVNADRYSASGVVLYVGGVVGGDINNGQVQNSVALNPSVRSTVLIANANIGRVTGITNARLSGNYARSGLTPETPTGTPINIAATSTTTGKDGADVTAGTASGQYNNVDFWTSTLAGWDFTNVWDMTTGAGNLPTLRNMP